jgi:hypothetical protein
MIVRVVFSVLVVVAGARPAVLAAQDAPPPCTRLPANLEVSEFLQPVIDALLRKSATFRRQCGIIAATRHAQVRVTAVWLTREPGAPRARATIHRFVYGRLSADIELPMVGDHFELLPHELEHVIEQIEGLDLSRMVAEGDRGVARIEHGAYETERARRAGLAAMDEVCSRNPARPAPR